MVEAPGVEPSRTVDKNVNRVADLSLQPRETEKVLHPVSSLLVPSRPASFPPVMAKRAARHAYRAVIGSIEPLLLAEVMAVGARAETTRSARPAAGS